MPGKSKEGGGLTSSPVYKKQVYGTAKSPFTMKGSSYPGTSPVKQHPKDFNIKGGPSKTPGWKPKISSDSWLTEYGKKLKKDKLKDLAKRSTKKILGTIGMYLGSMGTAKATQPGTGTHGGTKTPKLRDIDK